VSSFRTETTGKWILAGEHSVLRGSPALVFPLESRVLALEFLPASADGQLHLELAGQHGEELQILFWGVLEKACELKKVARSIFSGQVKLTSEIPVGAGLGASAALCVAMSRWFAHLSIISSGEVAEFSRTLENLFHGESSGVDIAVAISGQPLRFVRGQAPEVLPTRKWTPGLYVSYSGQRGMTVECVNRVKKLIAEDAAKGHKLDAQMAEAVQMCEKALQLPQAEGEALLEKAFALAADSFTAWGLTGGVVQSHMNWLREQGAAAVKPTGSGNGGFILSLWASPPRLELREKLIPCFQI
jgi:mevalonate kinase